MFMTGDLTVHKADGVTRDAKAAKQDGQGNLAVWDKLPEDEYRFAVVAQGADFQLVDMRTDKIIEPDIMVQEDKWERVERDGHLWKQTFSQALKAKAKKRDDVDSDAVEDQL